MRLGQFRHKVGTHQVSRINSGMSYGFIFNNDGITYRVERDTSIEKSNDEKCPVTTCFKHTFDGTNLTFSYVDHPADDPCSGRRADFNNLTYILSE